MKKLVYLFMTVSLVACSGEKNNESTDKDKKKVEKEVVEVEEQGRAIEDILKDLQDLGSFINNQANIDKAFMLTLEMYQRYPDSTVTENTMFQTALNVTNFGTTDPKQPKKGYLQKAVDLWDIIIKNYPDSKNIQRAYENKASILDIYLERDNEAIELYNYLIETYPEDTFNVSEYKHRIEHIDENPFDFM